MRTLDGLPQFLPVKVSRENLCSACTPRGTACPFSNVQRGDATAPGEVAKKVLSTALVAMVVGIMQPIEPGGAVVVANRSANK